MADVNLDAPLQAAQAQKGELQNLFNTQRGETTGFLNNFSNFLGSQPTSSALAERIGNELNLPQLRANSQSLNNTLFQLPQTFSAGTRGFDVNNNQLSRIVGQKQSEIAPAAALAQSNTQNAENTLTTRLGYEQADQNRALLPWQMEQGFLGDRLARETTGYSNQMQSELDAIIARMQAGITLSEGEKNRAQQLSLAESGYQNALKLAQVNNQAAPFMSVGEGNSIFDPKTGKFVATAPKTSVAGSGQVTPTLGKTAPVVSGPPAPAGPPAPQTNSGFFTANGQTDNYTLPGTNISIPKVPERSAVFADYLKNSGINLTANGGSINSDPNQFLYAK